MDNKNQGLQKPFEELQVLNIGELKKQREGPRVSSVWHNQLWVWLIVGFIVTIPIVILGISNHALLILVPLGPCLSIIFWAIKKDLKKIEKEDVFK